MGDGLRDDLRDGGVQLWVETINAVRRLSNKTTLETLIPDFKGNIDIDGTWIRNVLSDITDGWEKRG